MLTTFFIYLCTFELLQFKLWVLKVSTKLNKSTFSCRFDVMNSRCKNHQNRNLCALGGPNTDSQFNVLQRMLYFLKKFHVLHTKTGAIRKLPLPWEHGIRCSIKSTKSLYNDLVVNGPFEFLMTAKLNQDCLENLFSRIRGKGSS